MVIKKSVVVATSIVCASVIFAITSMSICRGIKQPDPEPTPEPFVDDLIERYKKWKALPPERRPDITSAFTLSELANLPIVKFKKENSKRLTVSRGSTLSMGWVNVDIAVSSIVDANRAYEESISYSSSPFAPRTGNRAYDEETYINRYGGNATSATKVEWEKDKPTKYTDKTKHLEASGKEISDPFFFVFSDETILTPKNPEEDPKTHEIYQNSKITHKNEGGYLLELQLKCANYPEAPNAIAKYAKRIKYLSPDTALQKFYHLKFNIETDDDFVIKKTYSDEHYLVMQGGFIRADTFCKLTTYYYTDKDVSFPKIPNIDEDFDYSKYQSN